MLDQAAPSTQKPPSATGAEQPAAGQPRQDVSELKLIHFHQLVSLIEMRRKRSHTVGEIGDPAREFLRFRSTRSLSFGAGDMSDVGYVGNSDLLEIRVNFFGLYGPASPLPPYFTERIIEQDQTPSSVEDLFDLFNHRLISLLHAVWRKYRYYLRYEAGGTDPLSKRFLALCGFPIEDRDRIGQIARSALLPHVGLMSLYSSSAEVVAATLSNFFQIPCRIEEFVLRSVPIREESRFQFGVANNLLGEDAVMGFSLEDDLGKFTIRLGEAAFDRLAPFLPDGNRHRQLAELLSMINREPLEWDIRFEFEPETVPMARLGECRLGWSSWMHAHEAGRLESKVHIAPVEMLSSDSATVDAAPAMGRPSDGPGLAGAASGIGASAL